MFDKLATIDARFEELERMMSDPGVMMDYTKITEYSKERATLSEIVEQYREYKRLSDEYDGAKEMIEQESDPELRAMAQEEIGGLATGITGSEERLRLLLLPKDARDDKNVIMEIRAGTGGDEAGLFAADLYRMYSYYGTARGWKIEVIDPAFDCIETVIGAGYRWKDG